MSTEQKEAPPILNERDNRTNPQQQHQQHRDESYERDRDRDRSARSKRQSSRMESSSDHSAPKETKKGKHRSSSRQRQWLKSSDVDDDSKEDSSSESEEQRHSRKKTKSNKEGTRHRKRSRSHRRDDNTSDSDSDSDASSERRRRRRRRRRETKKKDRKHGSHKKSKKRTEKDDKVEDDNVPSFGKHGILKASDLPRMQRTFDVWLAEVKGVQNQKLPKWELQNYFDSFREDYNTATLPHAKYYDYDKWEMQEYTRQQEAAAALEHAVASGGRISVLTDERAHAAERQRLRETKEAAALQLTAATMNPNKVADMKRQEQLRTQMQVAFRTGDKDTYRKLKEKLEADE